MYIALLAAGFMQSGFRVKTGWQMFGSRALRRTLARTRSKSPPDFHPESSLQKPLPDIAEVCISGGTKRATSVHVPLLCLQSSEGKSTMPREIEPVRRSFCRHGSCTFTEVARLVPSGRLKDLHKVPPAFDPTRLHGTRARMGAI